MATNTMGMTTDGVIASDRASTIPSFRVQALENWIRDRGAARYVAVTGMHGVSESREDSRFHEILEAADLVIPDGMP